MTDFDEVFGIPTVGQIEMVADFSDRDDFGSLVSLESEKTKEEQEEKEDDFKPANEVFKDPNTFDILSSHGSGSSSTLIRLARHSLYYNFDPLISGRTSIQQALQDSKDLIDMHSPPPSQPTARTIQSFRKISEEEVLQVKRMEMEQSAHNFIKRMRQKESELSGLDESMDQMRQSSQSLKAEVKSHSERFQQFRKILRDFEKTAEDLMDQINKDHANHKAEKDKLICQRDEAIKKLDEKTDEFSQLVEQSKINRQTLQQQQMSEKELTANIDQTKKAIKAVDDEYRKLKQQTAEQLQEIKAEALKCQKDMHNDSARQIAVLKRTEAKISTLQVVLEQKTKESNELNSIMEDLTAKIEGKLSS